MQDENIVYKTYRSITKVIERKEFEKTKEYGYQKNNIQYKNQYKGKRCFILGNGPSLKDVDFDLLKDEYVITVNKLMLNENFNKLRPIFHVWTDGNAFGTRKDIHSNPNTTVEELELLDKETILVLPSEAYKLARRKGLIKSKKIAFITKGKDFIEGNHDIDMCYTIPKFRTVVQYAIAIAMYAGFEEIYLLGCDGTLILSILDVAKGNSMRETHAYNDEEGRQEEAIRKLLDTHSVGWNFYAQYCVFEDYKALYKMCRNQGKKLYNLTKGSIIDTVPMKNLEEVLQEKKL